MYNQTAEAEGTPGLAANRIKAKWPELLGLITLCSRLGWVCRKAGWITRPAYLNFCTTGRASWRDPLFLAGGPPCRSQSPLCAASCRALASTPLASFPAASPSQRRLSRPYTRVDVEPGASPPPPRPRGGGQGAESSLQEPWMG